MSNATANRKADYLECKEPGDFFLAGNDDDKTRRMSFLCPCGCNMLAGVKLGPDTNDGCWKWDGKIENITITPSINIMDGPNQSHWHGFLTGGKFVSC